MEERAVRYVAKAADGSMRDALSLLDQCIAFHYGETLTYDMALDVLGGVDNTVFSKMLRMVIDKNVLGAITLLEEVIYQGRELTQFVTDFTWYLRNLLLLKSSDGIEDIIDVSGDNLALMKEEAELGAVLSRRKAPGPPDRHPDHHHRPLQDRVPVRLPSGRGLRHRRDHRAHGEAAGHHGPALQRL